MTAATTTTTKATSGDVVVFGLKELIGFLLLSFDLKRALIARSKNKKLVSSLSEKPKERD